MTYLIDPAFQFVDESGNPLTNGYIEVYNHETRDKVYTCSDFDGTLNEFRVRLNSLGCAVIIVDAAYAYDIFVFDAIGSLLLSRTNVRPEFTGTINVYEGEPTIVIPNESNFDDITDENVILNDGETVYQLSFKSDEKVEFSNTDSEHLNIWTVDRENVWSFEAKELSGQTLSAESPVKIEGNVIKVDTVELKVKAPLTFDEDTMEIALDPALCSINVDAITDWIDITDEWEFVNNFRLQYQGNYPGDGNAMSILYSPNYNYVKFTGSMRVNRTSALNTNTGAWNTFIRYNGNRFYTTDDSIDTSIIPKIGINAAIGGQVFIPGSDDDGDSTRSLLKLAYTGAPTFDRNVNGLSVQVLYNYTGSVYGCHCTNLILKVVPKT